MSLLIVRTPLKPLHGSTASSPSDWQDLACAERFEWCLLEGTLIDGSAAGVDAAYQAGVGTTESMPYADQALVLMPTLDVRLIEAKVPLANAKKLQQILPNLVEEYLLGGVEALSVQAFPPVPGKPALQRTLALIDRAWLAWLTKQCENLLCPRVRLIPDCLVLQLTGTEIDSAKQSIAPTTSFIREEGSLILTRRTGEQLGVAWVERENLEQGIALPSSFGNDQAVEISWDWLAPSAQTFIRENVSSKSANFALNLLPRTFRKQLGKSAFGSSFSSLSQLSKTAGLSGIFGRQQAGQAGVDSSAMSWSDPAVWQRSRQWLGFALATVVIGFVLHLSWLAVDNWRWGKRIELLAAQSLNSASVSALNQSGSGASYQAVLTAFIKQVTQDQRRQGVVTDADFSSMSAKLQQLKAGFGAEVLQSIDYDGYGIDFQFKPGALQKTPEQVMQQARTLGLMVSPLGANRYRLEPYSGLGGSQ